MKKIIMLILIIIIPFCIFIIISNTPRNYKTEYSINKLEVTEQYNKDNQTYLFIIKDNKLEIPYQVIHKYIKKRKLITNIKVEENCYTISVFESNYKLCTNDDKIIIDSNINNESPINTENNIEIYKILKNRQIKGIPKVYEIIEDEKELIIIEEYIHGLTLDKKYNKTDVETVKKIMEQYPRQSRAIESALNELSVCEREGSTDLDKTAGCFGKLMEELFLYKKDRWEETLRKMGFFMGKFIYLMDAYEDLPNDLEKGCYNPLKKIAEEEGYEERIKQILCMMIAESTAEFEKLPCLSDIDILRNILYDGVWNCYNKIQRKKSEEQKK